MNRNVSLLSKYLAPYIYTLLCKYGRERHLSKFTVHRGHMFVIKGALNITPISIPISFLNKQLFN